MLPLHTKLLTAIALKLEPHDTQLSQHKPARLESHLHSTIARDYVRTIVFFNCLFSIFTFKLVLYLGHVEEFGMHCLHMCKLLSTDCQPTPLH